MVPNSGRYASRKHWGPITKAMRDISARRPPSRPPRHASRASPTTGKTPCPAMIRSWRNSWDEFVPFGEFPPELRRVVYTTNAIESLNARFRRAVRHRGHFPNEQAAMKVHLPCRQRSTQEPHQPHRQDQRLESHPQHLDRPLRRPDRRPHPMNTTTTGYTEIPSAPVGHTAENPPTGADGFPKVPAPTRRRGRLLDG
ncbi:transposase [Candidatus Poriferisodalis sp.]|uniref:transposase n=1 Tax=Candidatus Poriferisodalis sp. TaxID=3101277 RepID=UPI003B020F08